MEALLSALSGGPVGVGDRIGETDTAIVAATCRADGLLVKPDAPIAAIARCFARHAVLDGAPHGRRDPQRPPDRPLRLRRRVQPRWQLSACGSSDGERVGSPRSGGGVGLA